MRAHWTALVAVAVAAVAAVLVFGPAGVDIESGHQNSADE